MGELAATTGFAVLYCVLVELCGSVTFGHDERYLWLVTVPT
jgi:hypothetical protein